MVIITIYHNDETAEWIVGDDGGEFDDEIFEGDNAEGEARNEAEGRFVYYQKSGHDVVQEQL